MAGAEIPDPDERAQALREIAALARRHGLTAPDVVAALGDAERGAGGAGRARSVLIRVLGVLGGSLVFAGVAVFVLLLWSDLNAAARVMVTLGPGLAAFVLAVLSHRGRGFNRAAPALFLVAGALEPVGILVALAELGSGGDWRWAGLAAAGAMALQFAATFRSLRLSTPLFLAVLFAALFSWTALDLLGAAERFVAMALGASLQLAAARLGRTEYRHMTPFWFLSGGTAFLAGLFAAVERTPVEPAFLAAAAGLVYLSVVWHSRTLLGVATAATLAYTAWFAGRYLADSVGWPLALIAFGLLMMALSALAVRIDRDYVRAR